jgi:hypothetical protein
VSDLTDKNFGVVIAFILPGFVAVWGLSYLLPTVHAWLKAPHQAGPTVAGFLLITLASLACGLTVSAVRWALIDTLHQATGVEPPKWDFSLLEEHLQAFQALVEYHYRFYQFYGNMFVAIGFAYRARLVYEGRTFIGGGWSSLGFVLLELVLLAGSRDALQKYYRRAEQLLRARSNPRKERVQ